MSKKKTKEGLTKRNKKRNNHKTTKKVSNKKEKKSKKIGKITTELKRCPITNKKGKEITEDSRQQTINKFKKIRDELNKEGNKWR